MNSDTEIESMDKEKSMEDIVDGLDLTHQESLDLLNDIINDTHSGDTKRKMQRMMSGMDGIRNKVHIEAKAINTQRVKNRKKNKAAKKARKKNK